jgi:hypothetical protein
LALGFAGEMIAGKDEELMLDSARMGFVEVCLTSCASMSKLLARRR